MQTTALPVYSRLLHLPSISGLSENLPRQWQLQLPQ